MLALGLGLAVLAWRLRGGSQRNLRIVMGALAVLALACAVNTMVIHAMLQPETDRQEMTRNWTATHVALASPQAAAGLTLPAGSVILWRSEDHKAADVQLPGPQLVNGIPLGARLTLNTSFWVAALSEDHTLEGWPCAAGEIYLGLDGGLQQCTLKSARALSDFTVPAGTLIEVETNNEFEPPLPVIKVSLKADTPDAAAGVTLAKGTSLQLFRNGSIEHAEPPPAGVRVRGILLSSYVYWHYGLRQGVAPPVGTAPRFLQGRLGNDLACAGRTIASGTWVGVPPAGSSLLVGDKEGSVQLSPVEGCLTGR